MRVPDVGLSLSEWNSGDRGGHRGEHYKPSFGFVWRQGAVLLALPSGSVPPPLLQAATEGDPFQVFGAHSEFKVPARIADANGEEMILDMLVIDADQHAARYLEHMPDHAPEGMSSFAPDSTVLPMAERLMRVTRDLLLLSQEETWRPMSPRGRGSRAFPSSASDPSAKLRRPGQREQLRRLQSS